MRALMDALGASVEQPSQGVGEGGSEGLLLGEVGASGEEREALLDAFGGLRCVGVVGFLACRLSIEDNSYHIDS